MCPTTRPDSAAGRADNDEDAAVAVVAVVVVDTADNDSRSRYTAQSAVVAPRLPPV